MKCWNIRDQVNSHSRSYSRGCWRQMWRQRTSRYPIYIMWLLVYMVCVLFDRRLVSRAHESRSTFVNQIMKEMSLIFVWDNNSISSVSSESFQKPLLIEELYHNWDYIQWWENSYCLSVTAPTSSQRGYASYSIWFNILTQKWENVSLM